MIDEEIVDALRSQGGRLEAVEIADLLENLTGFTLSHGTMVTYFKRAFPTIQLRVLLEAGAWMRLGGGELSDQGFNDLLRPGLQQQV